MPRSDHLMWAAKKSKRNSLLVCCGLCLLSGDGIITRLVLQGAQLHKNIKTSVPAKKSERSVFWKNICTILYLILCERF